MDSDSDDELLQIYDPTRKRPREQSELEKVKKLVQQKEREDAGKRAIAHEIKEIQARAGRAESYAVDAQTRQAAREVQFLCAPEVDPMGWGMRRSPPEFSRVAGACDDLPFRLKDAAQRLMTERSWEALDTALCNIATAPALAVLGIPGPFAVFLLGVVATCPHPHTAKAAGDCLAMLACRGVAPPERSWVLSVVPLLAALEAAGLSVSAAVPDAVLKAVREVDMLCDPTDPEEELARIADRREVAAGRWSEQHSDGVLAAAPTRSTPPAFRPRRENTRALLRLATTCLEAGAVDRSAPHLVAVLARVCFSLVASPSVGAVDAARRCFHACVAWLARQPPAEQDAVASAGLSELAVSVSDPCHPPAPCGGTTHPPGLRSGLAIALAMSLVHSTAGPAGTEVAAAPSAAVGATSGASSDRPSPSDAPALPWLETTRDQGSEPSAQARWATGGAMLPLGMLGPAIARLWVADGPGNGVRTLATAAALRRRACPHLAALLLGGPVRAESDAEAATGPLRAEEGVAVACLLIRVRQGLPDLSPRLSAGACDVVRRGLERYLPAGREWPAGDVVGPPQGSGDTLARALRASLTLVSVLIQDTRLLTASATGGDGPLTTNRALHSTDIFVSPEGAESLAALRRAFGDDDSEPNLPAQFSFEFRRLRKVFILQRDLVKHLAEAVAQSEPEAAVHRRRESKITAYFSKK